MSVADLSNDFVLSDPGRHLQQITSNTTLIGNAESGFDVAAGICYGGILILMILFACLSMYRCCLYERRRVDAIANAPSELLRDLRRVCKIPKSTLAERKQAILDLFETEQVTMVSNDHTSMGNPSEIKKFTSMEKLTTS